MTAPSAETPIAPPRERKKVTTELAEPRSDAATWFCVASTRFCIIMPMPRPITNMKIAMCQYVVSYRMVPSIPRPAVSRKPPLTSQAFQRPVLVMICPETVEERKRPAIIGIVITPDIVGDLPRASWKYWLKKTVPANIAIPTNSEASEASVIVRLRNSRSGMIGSLARDSVKTNSSTSTREPASITPVCQDIQSYLSPAKVTQRSSSETAALMKKAPVQSTLTSRLTTGSFRVFWSTIRAMTANGTPT